MISASAPAKVNLVFQVGPLEANGFHPVNSLYLEVDLREVITISQAELGSGITIYVQSDRLPARHVNAVPKDSTNLVYRVAELLFARAGIDQIDIEINIEKNIPVAGGMAGGSADAAAMLVACNEYLNAVHGVTPLSFVELVELGAALGSDIPFCLLGGLAVGTGKGEKLQPLAPMAFETHFVLVISNEGLSTPQVFAKFDQMGHSSSFTDLSKPIGSISDLAQTMSNDLEEPALALMPVISQIKSRLVELGALTSLVSGSGPTVFGLFESRSAAERAALEINDSGLLAIVTSASYSGTRLEQ